MFVIQEDVGQKKELSCDKKEEGFPDVIQAVSSQQLLQSHLCRSHFFSAGGREEKKNQSVPSPAFGTSKVQLGTCTVCTRSGVRCEIECIIDFY